MVAIVSINSKNKTIVEEFVHAIKKKDMQTIKQLFQEDQKEDLDTLSLNNFIQYLYENEDKLNLIEKSLQKQLDAGKSDSNAVVQLLPLDKKLGIFPNYELTLKNSRLQIENVDTDLIDISLDSGIFLNKHKRDHIYGPIFPGDHNIYIQFENELGTFRLKEEVTIWDRNSYVIKVNQEDVMTKDEQIKKQIFELSVYFSIQFIELMDNASDDELLFEEMDLFRQDTELSERILTGNESYKFTHAIFDDDSFEIMFIDHDWYANARIISTFERKDEEQVHLLFNLSYVYSELFDEWLLSHYAWDETNESIIDLWDSTLRLYRDDFVEDHIL